MSGMVSGKLTGVWRICNVCGPDVGRLSKYMGDIERHGWHGLCEECAARLRAEGKIVSIRTIRPLSEMVSGISFKENADG